MKKINKELENMLDKHDKKLKMDLMEQLIEWIHKYPHSDFVKEFKKIKGEK